MSSFQEKIQNVINSFDEGMGVIFLRILLTLCFSGLLFGVYASRQFNGLHEPEAMEYAQLARNISEGRGYVTQCIRPFDLWYLEKTNDAYPTTDNFPDLKHPPLYPVVLSLALSVTKPDFDVTKETRIFAPEKQVIIPLGIILTIATAAMLFLLGRKLVDARIGIIASFVYLLTDAVLAFAISGLPLPLISFLVTASLWGAVSAIKSQGLRESNLGWLSQIILTALFCLLAFLTSYKLLVLLPVLVVFLFSSLYRFRWIAVILLMTIVTIGASFWVMNNRSRGIGFFGTAPYAVAHDTSLYTNDSLERLPEPDIDNLRLFRSIKAGFASNMADLLSPGLLLGGGGIIVCFFIASLFHRFEHANMNEFRWSVILGLVLLFLASALTGAKTNRIFFAFLPLIALIGTATFVDYINKEEFFEAGWQTILIWALIILTALPAAFKIAGRGTSAYPPYYPPLTGFVCGLLDSNETICTDIPWATAWYGRQPSILLPQTLTDFDIINTKTNNIKGVYLTTETGNRQYTSELKTGAWKSWLPFLNGEAPENFHLKHAIRLPGGTRDQLFLTDSPRWEK